MDSILISISRLFLFKTLHLDASEQGVYCLWTIYITALRRFPWIIATRIQKRNWRVFAIPRLGDFNDENHEKGLRCVGRGIQMMKTLKKG